MVTIFDFKIKIPNCNSNMIPRDGLCEKIENSEKKIIVVKAGSGYGKTVGLTFFANRHKESCAWYNLEAMDDDFEVFVSYLAESIHKINPEFVFDYKKIFNNSENSQIDNMVAYEFASNLNKQQKQITIIFDGFQNITNELIDHFLNVFLDYTENNIRFIFSTNGKYPDSLSRVYLANRIENIGYEDLKLSLEEISYRLLKCSNVDDPKECAEELLKFSEGWAICVMSVILRINQERCILL